LIVVTRKIDSESGYDDTDEVKRKKRDHPPKPSYCCLLLASLRRVKSPASLSNLIGCVLLGAGSKGDAA